MFFAVVGNIKQTIVKNTFKKVFDRYSYSFPLPGDVAVREHFRTKEKKLSFNHASEQAMLGIYLNGTNAEETRKWHYANCVFTNCLGGGMHSVLFNRLREELGLCYNAGAYQWGFQNSNATILKCQLDKKNIDSANNEINKIITKIAKNGFSDELVKTAKRNVLFDIASKFETATGYSGLFVDDYFIDNEVNTLDYYRKEFDKVSNKGLIDYANRLKEGPQQIVIINKDK
jgi:predicted Zn-dependent peptidase